MIRPLAQARSKMRRAGSAAAGKRRLLLLVDHQFDRGQHAAAADLADERMVLQGRRPAIRPAPALQTILQQAARR